MARASGGCGTELTWMTSTQSAEAVSHSTTVNREDGGSLQWNCRNHLLHSPHGIRGLSTIDTYALCLTDNPFMALLFWCYDELICKNSFFLFFATLKAERQRRWKRQQPWHCSLKFVSIYWLWTDILHLDRPSEQWMEMLHDRNQQMDLLSSV